MNNRYIPGITQQENGSKGEIRTEAILVDDFWVSRRNVDAHGADFIVQPKPQSVDELWKMRNEPVVQAIVQAKYVKDSKPKIHRRYIETAEGPRNDFFLFVHKGDSDESRVYFYTAKDIVSKFTLCEDDKYYRYNNNDQESFDFTNRRSGITKLIVQGLLSSQVFYNQQLIWLTEANEVLKFIVGKDDLAVELSDRVIALLKDYTEFDGILVKRFLPLVFSVNGYPAAIEFDLYCLNFGMTQQIYFPYKIAEFEVVDGDVAFTVSANKRRLICKNSCYENSSLMKLKVVDEDDHEHVYFVNEGRGHQIVDYGVFRMDAILVNGPEWRMRTNRLVDEHVASPRCTKEFYFNSMSQFDLRRLEEIGFLKLKTLNLSVYPGESIVLKFGSGCLKYVNALNPHIDPNQWYNSNDHRLDVISKLIDSGVVDSDFSLLLDPEEEEAIPVELRKYVKGKIKTAGAGVVDLKLYELTELGCAVFNLHDKADFSAIIPCYVDSLFIMGGLIGCPVPGDEVTKDLIVNCAFEGKDLKEMFEGE